MDKSDNNQIYLHYVFTVISDKNNSTVKKWHVGIHSMCSAHASQGTHAQHMNCPY